jgi:hypothetical protein
MRAVSIRVSGLGHNRWAFEFRLVGSFERREFFAGLFILAFANGIVERGAKAITEDGVWAALLNTFDISIIVWAACWMALSLLAHSPPERITRTDVLVGAAIVVLTLAPFAPLSWIALTLLAFRVMLCAPRGSLSHRAGAILLALTVPMFWSRLLFATLSGPILRADSVLASFIVGTERVGNTTRFADNWGYLFIGPPCSSLANLSLAVLCWVLFSQAVGGRLSLNKIGWGMLAGLAVIAINVIRIGLIGRNHQYFELLHGPVGATVANWATLAVIVGVNLYAFRNELFIRA